MGSISIRHSKFDQLEFRMTAVGIKEHQAWLFLLNHFKVFCLVLNQVAQMFLLTAKTILRNITQVSEFGESMNL